MFILYNQNRTFEVPQIETTVYYTNSRSHVLTSLRICASIVPTIHGTCHVAKEYLPRQGLVEWNKCDTTRWDGQVAMDLAVWHNDPTGSWICTAAYKSRAPVGMAWKRCISSLCAMLGKPWSTRQSIAIGKSSWHTCMRNVRTTPETLIRVHRLREGSFPEKARWKNVLAGPSLLTFMCNRDKELDYGRAQLAISAGKATLSALVSIVLVSQSAFNAARPATIGKVLRRQQWRRWELGKGPRRFPQKGTDNNFELDSPDYGDQTSVWEGFLQGILL